MAGLLDPHDAAETEGDITLDAVSPRTARGRAGLVIQDPESALVMARAGDDVAFGLENQGVPPDEIWSRVDDALASVGFRYGRDHPTLALSGGEQQRLALAGILALRPGLLLLDEVTANLDADGRRLVHDVLAQSLRATGATAVIVEHRVDDVIDLVDRAVVIEAAGAVVADGTPHEVFARQGPALAAAGVWVPGHHPLVRRHAPGPPGRMCVVARRARFDYAQAEGAVAPIDAQLRAGSALAITGPNGSGKSTLALLLAGLLRPTSGSVDTPGLPAPPGGRPLWDWQARDLVRSIGTVFQDPEHQFVTGSVHRELMVGPVRGGSTHARAAARADELMHRLGLTPLADANPFTLSGGEKRRLSVATAIATAPAVLIADEPTFGQDSRTWAELAHLLADLRDQGTALAFVTHDRALVHGVSDDEMRLGAVESGVDSVGDER